MPTTGRLLIGLGPTDTTTWNVYADGRVIWQKWTSSGDATVVPDGARRLDTGYVQQRLTPQGVQLLLSKILATGLFEQDLTLDLGSGHAWAHHQVRRGDRIVTVISTPSPNPADPRVFTKATPAQMRGLAWIEKFVANPARCFRRARGRTARSGRSCRLATSRRFRSDLSRPLETATSSPQGARPVQAAQARRVPDPDDGPDTETPAGVREGWAMPSENHPFTIAFGLAGLRGPSDFHMTPALPDNTHCCPGSPLVANTRSGKTPPLRLPGPPPDAARRAAKAAAARPE